MTEARRPAPHPEWVQMYRNGITTPKIAAAACVGESTVRYHLRIAAQADPSIRADHQAAASKPARITPAGLQNMHDTIALYQAQGRLPSTKSPSARERAMAAWLLRRRQDHRQGTLTRAYRDGLEAIPGWERPTRKADIEAHWHERLAELTEYRTAGHDWPRHKKTDTEQERILGMWLHIQRMKHRREELSPDKEALLNARLPQWRVGRPGGRRPAGK